MSTVPDLKHHRPLHHCQDGTQSTILLSSSFVPNFRPAIGTVTAAFVSPPLQSTLQQQRQHHPSTTIGSHRRQGQNQRRTVQMLQGQPQQIQQSVSSTSGSDMVLSSEHREPSHGPPPPQHLVLIGGGHAHVQVLKALHSGIRPKYLQITLIDQVPSASYSGMVPGCIAGHYTLHDTQLQLVPLTEYSDIHFIHGTVIDIDLQQKLIYLKENSINNNSPIAFDVISIDIGSTSKGNATCPGAELYTIPTRPIDQLIYKLDLARQRELQLQQQLFESTKRFNGVNQQQQAQQLPQEQPQSRKRQLVVIGGGIAGIELAMTITSRWENDHIPFDTCTIIDTSHTLLPYENEYTRNVVQTKLRSKRIHVQYQTKVIQIDEKYVYTKSISSDADFEKDESNIVTTIPYTLCIWSTGAGAHSLSQHLYHQQQLDCDPESHWIRVHPTLQSVSHPFVFAAGDCCTIVQTNAIPSPPKAGVYAVRSGPILIENLTRYLESIRRTTVTISNDMDNINLEDPTPASESDGTLTLLDYKPQNDFLKLLVCGDGTAIGFRFGLVFQGEWVFRLKDDIDQSFMKIFDVTGLVKPIYDTKKTIPGQQVIGKYNTQQYDSNVTQKLKTAVVSDQYNAAALLRRTDNNVDIDTVRLILSQMGNDMTYRKAVVDSYYQQATMVQLQQV